MILQIALGILLGVVFLGILAVLGAVGYIFLTKHRTETVKKYDDIWEEDNDEYYR